MLALFPPGTSVAAGELELDGLAATHLAERFGTPLVVYSEAALRERARMFLRAAPEALVVYGTKAFPNVAVMRLLAEEGLGADVATLGELAYARQAGIEGARLIVHGNNKSDEELRAAGEAERSSRSTRSTSRPARPRPECDGCSSASRPASRPRPTKRSERGTAVRSSGSTRTRRSLRSPPRATRGWRSKACTSTWAPSSRTAARISRRSRSSRSSPTRCRDELDWTPALVDVGGGFGIRHVEDEPEPPVEELVRSIAAAVEGEWATRGLPAPRLVFEPGRSLVGPTAFTLYRVGAVKQAGDTRYVAIDGGMSDNPRPQLYDARYSALLANRADEEPADGHFTIAGKHCESGDVLIEQAVLPEPRRGDLLAVPATGRTPSRWGRTTTASRDRRRCSSRRATPG